MDHTGKKYLFYETNKVNNNCRSIQVIFIYKILREFFSLYFIFLNGREFQIHSESKMIFSSQGYFLNNVLTSFCHKYEASEMINK